MKTGIFAATLAASILAAIPGATLASETLHYPATTREVYTFPYIGTPRYSDSCEVVIAWEDHSAYAYCWEDGASYAYDPDGNPERESKTPMRYFTNRSAGWSTVDLATVQDALAREYGE